MASRGFQEGAKRTNEKAKLHVCFESHLSAGGRNNSAGGKEGFVVVLDLRRFQGMKEEALRVSSGWRAVGFGGEERGRRCRQ